MIQETAPAAFLPKSATLLKRTLLSRLPSGPNAKNPVGAIDRVTELNRKQELEKEVTSGFEPL
jgi:hypothetical protein